MAYEQDQRHLQSLMEQFLSDENSDDSIRDQDFEVSDEEISSSSSNESVRVPKKKKPKIVPSIQYAPSTSGVSVSAIPIDDTIESVISKYRLPDVDSSSSDEENTVGNDMSLTWRKVDGRSLKNISFGVENSGIKNEYFDMYDKKPLDFFELFVNNDIIELIVEETNRYVHQKLNKGGLLPKARLCKWVNTNNDEVKIFLALLIWMGLVRLPKMASYWSKNPLYENKIKYVMSRNLIMKTVIQLIDCINCHPF